MIHAMRLLGSSLLRRVAYPLRMAHPATYVVMNRIRQQLLRRGTSLHEYQAVAVRRFLKQCVGSHRTCSVLEVGSDRDRNVLRAISASVDGWIIGVNNDPSVVECGPGPNRVVWREPQLVHADAAALPFDDGEIGHVFSIAAFEHIHRLPVALGEMYRVLRKGGTLYAKFGPIWSAGRGHHVNAQVAGTKLHHATPAMNPLPDFSHLLLDEGEMRQALGMKVERSLAGAAVQYVYHSPAINRLLFHEYEEAIRSTRFRLRSMVTEDDPVARQLRSVLEFRHPAERRFEVTNVEIILDKR